MQKTTKYALYIYYKPVLGKGCLHIFEFKYASLVDFEHRLNRQQLFKASNLGHNFKAYKPELQILNCSPRCQNFRPKQTQLQEWFYPADRIIWVLTKGGKCPSLWGTRPLMAYLGLCTTGKFPTSCFELTGGRVVPSPFAPALGKKFLEDYRHRCHCNGVLHHTWW